MTRKQALQAACRLLTHYDSTGQTKEIVDKLKEIVEELPITNWTEETIFDTCNQWIIEHNKIPTTKDLTKKGLPPIPVIKNKFNLTGKQFLNHYYPKPKLLCNSLKFGNKPKEEWINLFIEEYEKLKPTSATEYNIRRNKDLPSWITLAHLINCNKWTELIKYCNLPIYKKEKRYVRKHLIMNISHTSDIDDIK